MKFFLEPFNTIFKKSIIINFKQYQTISNNIKTISKQYQTISKIKFIYKQKLKSRHEKNIIQLPMVKQDQLYPKMDQISKKKSKD